MGKVLGTEGTMPGCTPSPQPSPATGVGPLAESGSTPRVTLCRGPPPVHTPPHPTSVPPHLQHTRPHTGHPPQPPSTAWGRARPAEKP